ncbi:MAG: hypothetical protein AB8B89_07035 [Gammaproteobacteria bacterium]
MSKKKKTSSPALKEVRTAKYRQRVAPNKEKQEKKNPCLEDFT